MIQTLHILIWLSFAAYFEFCIASSASCSSLGILDEFNTTCSNSQYYCDIDRRCKPRGGRCTDSPSCVDFNGVETAGCNCDASGLRCDVKMGSHSLFRKKREIRLEHDFIEYKGFVWEYGCYGTRILDINDPLFGTQRRIPLRNRTLGKSSCSYSDALLFLKNTGNKYTSAKYSLLFNNCQDFAAAFSRWLLDDCTTRRKLTTSDTPVDLTDYFTQLIESCSSNECKLGMKKIKARVRVGRRLAKYIFSTRHPHVTFKCKFDNEEFVNCTSPRIQKISTLSCGRHTFVVVAKCKTGSSKARKRISYRVC